ncbi:MAG: WavQ [Sulfurimonadaceae bacterium]
MNEAQNNISFVIYTYRYNTYSGGTMVLHYLCHLLNQQKYTKAYIWPNYKPLYNSKEPFKSTLKFLKYWRKSLHKKFALNPSWNTPLATKKDLDNSIIIYPEIVEGNPLMANKVVRWLLHKPGFHFGKIQFGESELILGYGQKFSTPEFTITDANTFHIAYIMDDIYIQTNFKKRVGTCHMIRKGTNKPLLHEKDSICVDGMSHQELAKVFNECETFICYDPYTYYSVYAALCGCKSIVIPDDNVSKEQWHPQEKDRYGIAYGLNEEEITYAQETLQLLKNDIKKQQNNNQKELDKFLNLCKTHFKDQ